MLRDIELTMRLPCVVFSSHNRFNDYSSDDMQSGDLDETQLLSLGLDDVSIRVDPYRLLRFDSMQSRAYRRVDYGTTPSVSKGSPITRAECKSILFDEMRELSTQFANGQFAFLISEMINNFQNGNGVAYRNQGLDEAFLSLIQQTKYGHTLGAIKEAINDKFVGGPLYDDTLSLEQQISRGVYRSKLHKFNRSEDNFNGLGITMHDIHAQEIKLFTLRKTGRSWSGIVQFKAQDHFGLDKKDITNPLFRNLRFFRIWFFLQRHKDYSFKPFLTNFSANVKINGDI